MAKPANRKENISSGVKAKNVLLLLLFVLIAFSLQAQPAGSTGTKLKVGEKIPNFQFETAPDKQAHLSDYKGKIVLLNFFASWCPPCNAEFLHLQHEIWEKYRDDPHFILLAFGREHNWQEVNAFAKKKQVTFPVLPDPKRKIFSLFAAAYIPRNILLDEKGKIIFQSVGFEYKDFRSLKKLIEKRLKMYKNKN